jgi:hypothetical protein
MQYVEDTPAQGKAVITVGWESLGAWKEYK